MEAYVFTYPGVFVTVKDVTNDASTLMNEDNAGSNDIQLQVPTNVNNSSLMDATTSSASPSPIVTMPSVDDSKCATNDVVNGEAGDCSKAAVRLTVLSDN